MTTTELTREIVKLIDTYAPRGTKFAWDRATTRFGCCSYKRNRLTGEFYGFKITISYPLASRNTWEVIKKTVLHEIAHARTPGHNHDRVWVRECLAIGGDGERCYSNVENGGDVNAVPKKFLGTCPCCGKTFLRNRRSLGAYHCDKHAPIVWTLNTKAVA